MKHSFIWIISGYFAESLLMKRTLLFINILFLVSCGTQYRLQKSYSGKPVETLKKEFGIPLKVVRNQADSVYVYEKKQKLQSTEISQGKLTLDPIITPSAVKTKRYYFTVKKGIISNVRYAEGYER